MSELSLIFGEAKKIIKLSDGKEIELRPLTMLDLARLEDEIGCDMSGWEVAFRKLKNILTLILFSLKKAEPTMTYEKLGELFTASDTAKLQSVVEAILEISGLKKKDSETNVNPA